MSDPISRSVVKGCGPSGAEEPKGEVKESVLDGLNKSWLRVCQHGSAVARCLSVEDIGRDELKLGVSMKGCYRSPYKLCILRTLASSNAWFRVAI